MLRIAVCDDDRSQLTLTEQLLLEYRAQHPQLDLRISLFASDAALLEHLRFTGAFDVYLLDVLMPGENGIDLGLKIRELDCGGHILYLTSSPDYAIESYLVRASHYMLKPVDKVRLFSVLDEQIEEWLREHQSFATIKTRSGLQRVLLRNVVYGELVGHCIQYHLDEGTTLESRSVRTSFREAVSAFLEHDRFVLCSTSFFVNLSYVDMIETNGLRLTGGGTLPLSRAMRTDVTNRWLDYHLKGGVKL